jgi:hypothetical protein
MIARVWQNSSLLVKKPHFPLVQFSNLCYFFNMNKSYACGMDAAVSFALAEVLPQAKLPCQKSTWNLNRTRRVSNRRFAVPLLMSIFDTNPSVNSNSLSLSLSLSLLYRRNLSKKFAHFPLYISLWDRSVQMTTLSSQSQAGK